MKLSIPIYQLKRRAKKMARHEKIALNIALDRIAQGEGFASWSLLSSQFVKNAPLPKILSRLSDGDFLVLGARPGHGKTQLGLQLLLDAAYDGRKAILFSLEYTKREAEEHIRSLAGATTGPGTAVEIETSNDICADYIIDHLARSARGTVAVIDYLQILDQQRTKPALSEQITALKGFARKSGVVLGFVSQIDRSFDPESSPTPGIRDIRLPNRIDPHVFSKACFLHEGEFRFQEMA